MHFDTTLLCYPARRSIIGQEPVRPQLLREGQGLRLAGTQHSGPLPCCHLSKMGRGDTLNMKLGRPIG